MVELAWLWQRYFNRKLAQVAWFRDRPLAQPAAVFCKVRWWSASLRKATLIALCAIAVIDGVMPEGAVMKTSI